MRKNNHTHVIPDDILTQVQAKVDEVRALLDPYLLALTPEERRNLLKMGPKTIGFVEKAHDFAKQNPALVPAYLDMELFKADVEGSRGFWTLINSVKQLEQHLCDTEMTAGSEAFQAALTFYNFIKLAASKNSLGAKAIHQELKIRFPRRRRRKADESPPTLAVQEASQS